jgi:Acetyltransferase (GNAT) domain
MIETLADNDAAKSEWNEFLRLSPQGSIFASTLYLDALGVPYKLLVMRRDGQIVIGLPLVRGLGGFLTNPLFCKYLGVIMGPARGEKSSLAAGQAYRRIEALRDVLRSSWSFDYTFHPNFENWLPFYWLGFAQQTLYTYRISRAKRSNWWTDAESSLRGAVRRAQKNEVSVTRVEDFAGVETSLCYSLCMEPFRRRNAHAPLSDQRFGRLVTKLSPNGLFGLWIARDVGGRGVAAAGVLRDWRCSYLLLNGTSEEAPTGSNSLLIKTIIDDTLGMGLDFDFEGSMIRPIEAFYRSFGGDRTSYYRIWNHTVANSVKRTAIKWARRLGGYER